MADYVSNVPVSGPRSTGWKPTWDIGGMAWSDSWGFFYDVAAPDDQVELRKPNRPIQGGP